MPEEREWTKSQNKAITSGGQAIVVSAAAGSGKTTVLIERIIRKILAGNCNVDELLIVTFTRAATAEIRTRLSTAITDALKENPNDSNLIKQQMLVPSANIFTIDAFCADLVRNNFETLGIRPDFGTLDDGLNKVYSSEAMSAVLDKYYEENSASFNILKSIIKDSFNYKFEQAINDIYTKAQAYTDPQKVLKESLSYYEFDGPVKDAPVVKEAIKGFLDYADYILDGLNRSISFLESNEEIISTEGGRKVRDMLSSDRSTFEECCGYVKNAEFEKAFKLAEDYSPDTWSSSGFPQKADFELKVAKYYRDLANGFTNKAKKGIKSYFGTGLKAFESDREVLLPALKTLLAIVEDFDAEYRKIKEEKNVLDFSDIEHLAYSLLIKDGKKTQLACDLSKNYKEILIDEYQDTNELQDAIFSAISDNENNLFMVGDIKQSIYAFRNAMPQLFLHKKDTYPGSMSLGENFRCSYGIIEYVNFLFAQIMSKDCGDIDYSKKEEQLQYGRKEKCDPSRPDVELHLFEGNKTKNLPTEGRYIAKYISEAMEKDRDLKYSDFAILMRKVASDKGSKVAQALVDANIPVAFEGGADFFDTADVKIVLSLLHVIDNPLQDVHMLAVLMSPVFSLSADTITKIRCQDKNTSLYANLLSLKDSDSQICSIIDTISLYRQLSITMPVGELIRKIYSDTLLPDIVAAMPNGPSRQANLLLLQDYADNYEQSSELGISNFVRFTDTLIENELDLNTASLGSGTTNAVKLMTIHKSKGLQFTHVILPNLGDGKYTPQRNIIVSKDMKIGLKACEPVTGDTFPSFVFSHIKESLKPAEASEELRVLYVAMTRAKEKLILIGSPGKDGINNAVYASELNENGALPPYMVVNSKNPLDLIISATTHHLNAEILEKTAKVKTPVLPCDTKIIVEIHPAEDTEQEAEADAHELSSKIDDKMQKELSERMNYEYPYLALSMVPTKRSASATEAAGFDTRYFASAEPEFLRGDKLTPAQKGTCLHRFMQFAEFDEAKTDAAAEVQRLYAKGYFTEAEAAAIDVKKVEAFFRSDMFARMERSEKVWREHKFAVLVPAVRFNPSLKGEMAEETVLIQGIADCVFVEDDKLVIVDYKTDRTTVEEELINRHKAQLMTYAEALTDALAMPVKEAYVYAFSLDKEIKVI